MTKNIKSVEGAESKSKATAMTTTNKEAEISEAPKTTIDQTKGSSLGDSDSETSQIKMLTQQVQQQGRQIEAIVKVLEAQQKAKPNGGGNVADYLPMIMELMKDKNEEPQVVVSQGELANRYLNIVDNVFAGILKKKGIPMGE